MSARDEAIEMIRRICPPHLSRDEYGQFLGEKFDAYAHELAELQRLRMAELDLTGQKARLVGRIVDLIDPEAK